MYLAKNYLTYNQVYDQGFEEGYLTRSEYVVIPGIDAARKNAQENKVLTVSQVEIDEWVRNFDS